MKKVMTRAWEIRREAAVRFSVALSMIIFAECLRMAWAETKETKMEEPKTIREYIQEATKDAKTQVDLDRIWHNGFPRRIKEVFPKADSSEIMYEWESVKTKIRKMV
jgi:hypothetical protein